MTPVERLQRIGAWLDVNGEAIYATRSMTPFMQRDEALDVRFTRKQDTLYAVILAQPMQQRPPMRIETGWRSASPRGTGQIARY